MKKKTENALRAAYVAPKCQVYKLPEEVGMLAASPIETTAKAEMWVEDEEDKKNTNLEGGFEEVDNEDDFFAQPK